MKLNERRRGTASGAWDDWLAWLTIVVAVIGMFVSTPRLAGADEPAHQATAWYVSSHIWTPTDEGIQVFGPIPGALVRDACFAFKPEQSVACQGPPGEPVAEAYVYNYPPVYYWGVAVGQRIADAVGGASLVDVGGRFASMLMNLGLLLAVAVSMRRRYRLWGTYLLLLVTPMVAFYWAVVNPSGWEITTAIAFAYAFWAGWTNPVPNGSSRRWHLRLAAIGSTSLLLGLARPSSFLWLCCLVAAVVTLKKPDLERKRRIMALGAAGLGVAGGLVWYLTHSAELPLRNPQYVAHPGIGSYVSWFAKSLNEIPAQVEQMIGNLGWLDTPTPPLLALIVIIAWAVFLTQMNDRNRIPGWAWVAGLGGVVLIPAAIEALGWNRWPAWWQGRYTLPFLASFLLLLLLRSGRSVPGRAIALSLLVTFLLAFMAFLNTMRYSFGIDGIRVVQVSDRAGSSALFAASLGAVALLGLILVVRACGLLSGSRFRSVTPRPAPLGEPSPSDAHP